MIDQSQAQQQEPELSATELASLGSTEVVQPAPGEEGAAAAQEVLYDEVPEEKFWKALPIATGGKVQSRETFNQLLQRNEQFPAIENKLRELEAKANISPYATPFTEQINKLVANATPPEKLLEYVKLSLTNPDQMSEYDILKTSLGFDPAGFSKDQIEALIEDKFGLAPDTKMEDLTALQSAQLKQAVMAAKAEINGRRVAYEQTYQPSEAAIQEQARNADVVSRWEAALPAMKPDVAFRFEEEGVEAYEFKYNPPAEVVEKAREIIMNSIRQNPGQYPPTESGYQQAKTQFNNLIMLGSQEDYRAAMYRDIVAKVSKQAVLDKAGPVPTRQAATPPSTTQKKGLTAMDAIM